MEGPVDLPEWSEAAPAPAASEGPKPELMNRIDVRMHPGDSGFRSGEPSGRAEMRGWFALAGEEPIDAIESGLDVHGMVEEALGKMQLESLA